MFVPKYAQGVKPSAGATLRMFSHSVSFGRSGAVNMMSVTPAGISSSSSIQL